MVVNQITRAAAAGYLCWRLIVEDWDINSPGPGPAPLITESQYTDTLTFAYKIFQWKLFQLFQMCWLGLDIHSFSKNSYINHQSSMIKTQSITIVLHFFLTLFTVKTGLTTLMIGHEQVDEDYIMNRLVDPIKNMSARWENGKSGKLKETRFNPASII